MTSKSKTDLQQFLLCCSADQEVSPNQHGLMSPPATPGGASMAPPWEPPSTCQPSKRPAALNPAAVSPCLQADHQMQQDLELLSHTHTHRLATKHMLELDAMTISRPHDPRLPCWPDSIAEETQHGDQVTACAGVSRHEHMHTQSSASAGVQQETIALQGQQQGLSSRQPTMQAASDQITPEPSRGAAVLLPSSQQGSNTLPQAASRQGNSYSAQTSSGARLSENLSASSTGRRPFAKTKQSDDRLHLADESKRLARGSTPAFEDAWPVLAEQSQGTGLRKSFGFSTAESQDAKPDLGPGQNGTVSVSAAQTQSACVSRLNWVSVEQQSPAASSNAQASATQEAGREVHLMHSEDGSNSGSSSSGSGGSSGDECYSRVRATKEAGRELHHMQSEDSSNSGSSSSGNSHWDEHNCRDSRLQQGQGGGQSCGGPLASESVMAPLELPSPLQDISSEGKSCAQCSHISTLDIDNCV